MGICIVACHILWCMYSSVETRDDPLCLVLDRLAKKSEEYWEETGKDIDVIMMFIQQLS